MINNEIWFNLIINQINANFFQFEEFLNLNLQYSLIAMGNTSVKVNSEYILSFGKNNALNDTYKPHIN